MLLYQVVFLACEPGLFETPEGKCVQTCQWPYGFTDTAFGKCLEKCDSKHYTQNGDSSFNCVANCPHNKTRSKELGGPDHWVCCDSCSDVQYYVVEKNVCVSVCPQEYPYTSLEYMRCYTQCPDGVWILSQHQKICARDGLCPSILPRKLADEEGQSTCLASCNQDGALKPYQLPNMTCATHCDTSLRLFATQEKQCVLICPNEEIYASFDQSSNQSLCTHSCPSGWFETQTKDVLQKLFCVTGCDLSKLYFIDAPDGSKECVSQCPSLADATTKRCVDVCLASQFIVESLYCFDACPDGYSPSSDHNCIKNSPDNKGPNLTWLWILFGCVGGVVAIAVAIIIVSTMKARQRVQLTEEGVRDEKQSFL